MLARDKSTPFPLIASTIERDLPTTALEKHPIDWKHLVLQMIEATQEAIADASLHKTDHTATQGQQEKSEAGGSRYSFLLTDDWEPGANTRVRIKVDPNDSDQTIAGTILSTMNARITLATEVNREIPPRS